MKVTACFRTAACRALLASLLWPAATPWGGDGATPVAGAADPTFEPYPGLSGPVTCLLVGPDQRILAAGTLERSGPEGGSQGLAAAAGKGDAPPARLTLGPRRTGLSVVRMLAGGAPDNTFTPAFCAGMPGIEAAGVVRAMALQADGKVIVAGRFEAVNGAPRRGLARLNADGSLDRGFDAGQWFQGEKPEVRCLAVQSDGRILVGGQFDLRGGWTSSRLVRFNGDGSLDPRLVLGDGFDGPVDALAVCSEGTFAVGGAFTALRGTPVKGLVRLREDGSLDPAFNLAPLRDALAYSAVKALGVLPGGALLVAGELGHVRPAWHHGLIRVNPDGTLEAGFLPAPGVGDWIDSVWPLPDGKVLALGGFYSPYGFPQDRVFQMKADGSLDTSFEVPYAASATTLCLAAQADGKVLLGGRLGLPDSLLSNGVARLTGSTGPAILAAPQPQCVGVGARAALRAEVAGTEPISCHWLKDGAPMVPAQDRTVLEFPEVREADAGQYSLRASNRFGQVTSPAVALTVTPQPEPPRLLAPPRGLTREEGGQATFEVVAVGSSPLSFQWLHAGTNLADATASVLRLYDLPAAAAGSYAVRVGNAAGEVVSDPAELVLQTPPRIVNQTGPLLVLPGDDATLRAEAAGSAPLSYQWFWNGAAVPEATNSVLNVRSAQPARAGLYHLRVGNPWGITLGPALPLIIGQPGSLDPTFQAGLEGAVFSVALQADGKVLIGGGDLMAWNPFRKPVARLLPDGSLDAGFDPLQWMGWFCDTCTYPEYARAYAWTDYVVIEGNLGLARFLPDGRGDTNFHAVTHLRASVAQPDGRLVGVLSSHFQSPCTVVRIRTTGESDPTFAPASVDGYVWCVTLQPDGQVLVGGSFSRVNGELRAGLARLRSDGALDASFRPELGAATTPFVHAIVAEPDGCVAIGGDFLRVNGMTRRHLARLKPDGSLVTGFAMGSGPDWPVRCLARQTDGRLVIGGSFTTVDGVPRHGIARLDPRGAVDARFDPGSGFSLGTPGALGTGPVPYPAQVESLAIQPDGQVLVAGSFTSFNGFPCSGVVRLNGGGAEPYVVRQLPSSYSPGSPLTVQLLAGPGADTLAYAVEDQPPPGWVVSDLSHAGALDPATGKVKYGPFFDNLPRALTYVVAPPGAERADGVFSGLGSFDGRNEPITGHRVIVAANRLASAGWSAADGFMLELSDSIEGRYVLEASSDLRRWEPLPAVLSPTGQTRFLDPAARALPQRFYRGRLAE